MAATTPTRPAAPAQPVFVLKLVALPGAVPAVVRLRALLKVALRAFRMKCVGVSEEPPTGRQADDGAGVGPA